MGRERRRRNRRSRRGGQPPAQTPEGGAKVGAPGERRARPGWYQTLQSWGGPTVLVPLVLAVLAIIALIVINQGGGDGDEPYSPIARAQVDGRILGDPGAPVRIIEYADFQCPHCRDFATETEPELVERYVDEGIASLEFRHFPVLGDDSVRAAEAAECALQQDRFWDYHDILFLRQGRTNAFSEGNLQDYARELAEEFDDFDVDAFDECLESGEMEAGVRQMQGEAQAEGVQSTPSFFVNGELIRGNQPIGAFEQAIEQARAN